MRYFVVQNIDFGLVWWLRHHTNPNFILVPAHFHNMLEALTRKVTVDSGRLR